MSRTPEKLFISIIWMIFLTSISIPVMAENIECDFCGKIIRGKYWTVGKGLTICDSCYQSSPKCALCGKPMKDWLEREGKKICRECFVQAKLCSVCGQPILGEYQVFAEQNKFVCDKCLKTKERCQICGIPLKEYKLAHDQKVCPFCFKNAPLCYACGLPIVGEAFFYNADKSKPYCQWCVKKGQHCTNCGAPVGERFTRLKDKRIICYDCLHQAIFDPERVFNLRDKIISFLGNKYDLKVKHNIEYELVWQDKFSQLTEKENPDQHGLFERNGEQFSIYILYGLSEARLTETIAHEYAHAWQAEVRPFDLELLDIEGFAQWVALKVLEHFSLQHQVDLMLSREDVYGEGLRKMLKIEKEKGADRVFEYVRGE